MTYSMAPYLTFRAKAGEAMEFYRSVFGGELVSNTYGDLGLTEDPAEAGLVRHAQLVAPQVTLMAGDVLGAAEVGSGVSVSLFGDPAAATELHQVWERLAWRGSVAQPLERAPWGDDFGQVTDRFGVIWRVNIGVEPSAV